MATLWCWSLKVVEHLSEDAIREVSISEHNSRAKRLYSFSTILSRDPSLIMMGYSNAKFEDSPCLLIHSLPFRTF